jgi:hypothetical protein
MSALKKSKFKPGDTVFGKTHRHPDETFILTLIKYLPNYEWHAEYIDSKTGNVKRDYFDERDFD